ncbi:COG3339 Uncharacterized conserved protein [Rhabdaerophilaceae bacterium]
MTDHWQQSFSKAEMEAIRRAARDEAGILAEVLAMARRLARRLPFGQDILATYVCVRDPATSLRVKLILLAALAYFVMPIDGIPDLIPVLGFSDDAAMLTAAIATVRGAITDDHRREAQIILDETQYSP